MTQRSDDNRSNRMIPLAEGFDDAGHEDWAALVEQALKGRPIDKALHKTTYEGVTIKGLYRAGEARRHESVHRAAILTDRAHVGWDIQQLHSHPDPAGINADIRGDLDGGASSVLIRLDSYFRGGVCTDFIGDGLIVKNLDALDSALDGIDLSRTGVSFRAGAASAVVAAALFALARRRGSDAKALIGSVGVDPLSTLAETGCLPGPLVTQLQAMNVLACWCEKHAPAVNAIEVDTSPYHAAGATETQDLAFSLSTGVAYLRSLTGAGMTLENAASQIGFSMDVGPDVFQVMAKLRAARRLWDRVIEASGGAPLARAMRLSASTASRMLSRRAVWVNQLRTTASCFAAGSGGADRITVRANTDALGLAEPLARRIARNIQTILVQESSLARVADPAGGSYYVEQLTEEYARRAWTLFQEIEAVGGMASALISGKIKEMVTAAWLERERNLAHRRDELTGVSSFPDLDEVSPGILKPNLDHLRNAPRGEESIPLPEEFDMEAMITAVSKGARLDAILGTLEGERVHIAPLTSHRLGESFEALRDAADRHLEETGKRPEVLIARLGKPVDYTARGVFAKTYFATAGIATIEVDVEAGKMAGITRAGSSELVVICSSDRIYNVNVEAVVGALKGAGTKIVVLAGYPSDEEDRYRAAGVDRFIHAGDDMLTTLQEITKQIGMVEA